MRILLCLFIGLMVQACGVQPKQQSPYITLATASSKLQKQFKKIQAISSDLQAQEKYKQIQELTARYPNFVDGHMEKAVAAYDLQLYDAAYQAIQKAIQLHPSYQSRMYYIAATIARKKGALSDEQDMLQQYSTFKLSPKKQEKTQKRLSIIQELLQLQAASEPIELISVGAQINATETAEYKPVVSINDSLMIFTRRVNGQEDFYESRYDNGAWQEAKPIKSLNTPGNEGAHAISADGKYMIYTKCDAPRRYRSCDLYISMYKNNQWTEGQYMSIINTEAWESQASFSPDGNTIYFSSNRAGGQGGKDLYYIERINNKWQGVKSMGATINTAGNEEAPFMHPDGKTLYFMSDGHLGFGGQDLFVTRKQFDGSWSKPENLGSYINSTADEGGIFVDIRGAYAYFSKSKKTEQGVDSDIYKFKLPKSLQPIPSSYIKIRCFDARTKEAISADIKITELGSQQEMLFKIPKKQGKTIIISTEEHYAVQVSKENYLFYSETIDPTVRTSNDAAIHYNIYLQALQSRQSVDTLAAVALRNIHFETGSATLLPSSFNELNQLVELLNKQKNAGIILNGHTDNVGNEDDNVTLSANRAKAVQTYLISKGIAASRIDTKAWGESRPLESNDTAEGRARNRRITFQITYQ